MPSYRCDSISAVTCETLATAAVDFFFLPSCAVKLPWLVDPDPASCNSFNDLESSRSLVESFLNAFVKLIRLLRRAILPICPNFLIMTEADDTVDEIETLSVDALPNLPLNNDRFELLGAGGGFDLDVEPRVVDDTEDISR